MGERGHPLYDDDDLDSPLLKEHLTHLKKSMNHWNCEHEAEGRRKQKGGLGCAEQFECLNSRGGASENACRPYAELPFDLISDFKGKSPSEAAQTVVRKALPCLRWIRKYNLSKDLWSDITSGLSVGFMAIPESMAYARIAGLPTIYGLYASFVPIFTYAIFGSSPQLAVGPVAIVSLLVSESLKLVVPRPEGGKQANSEEYEMQYARMALLLAMLVGIVQAAAGIFRLGTLVRFLSHSVVSGFASGSAIIIALTQAKNILGCNLPESSQLHVVLLNIWNHVDKAHIPTLLTGVAMLLFLLFTKFIQKVHKSLRFLRIGGPLIGAICGTLFIRFTNNCYGIRTVGELPQGFPPFRLDYEWKDAQKLLVHAVVIAGVSFMESIAIAKALASKNGYDITASQELVGIGMANIIGSMFSSYPVAGSVSRSAVSDDTGARTNVAGIVTGLLVLGSLLYLTTIFRDLPFCVLAAIIISAVHGLLNFSEVVYLYQVNKRDCLVWLLAFVGVVFFSVQVGVVVAVVISLGFILHETANPHTAVLGRLPGTTVYRNVKQYPDAKRTQGIVIVRIDAPIFFANIPFLKDCLERYEYHALESTSQQEQNDGGEESAEFALLVGEHHKDWYPYGCLPESERVGYLVLELTPVPMIDSDGCKALTELYHQYHVRGVTLAICNPNRSVMDAFKRSGIIDLIGQQWFFVHAHEAVLACLADKKRKLDDFVRRKKELVADVENGNLNSDTAEVSWNASCQKSPLGRPPSVSGPSAKEGSKQYCPPNLVVRLPSIKTHSKAPPIASAVLLPAAEVLESPHVMQQEINVPTTWGVPEETLDVPLRPPQATYRSDFSFHLVPEDTVNVSVQPPQATYLSNFSFHQVDAVVPMAPEDRQGENFNNHDN